MDFKGAWGCLAESRCDVKDFFYFLFEGSQGLRADRAKISFALIHYPNYHPKDKLDQI